MKHLAITILTFFICTLLYAQNTPVEYLNKLSADYEQINKDTWDYIRQASRGKNASKVEKRRKELAATLKSAKYRVSRVRAYQGDASLKNAYARYLDLTYQVINNGYKEIVDMERVAEESYDAMEAYLLMKEQANEKLDSAFNIFYDAFGVFTTTHNIKVNDDKSRIARKLDNAGKVNKYYNKLYLIFFKSSFYENEMIKATSEGRIGDIEQFRQTLETVSREGQSEAKEVGSYNGDNTLKYACIKILEFFVSEATKYMPKQIDFFTKKDRFETLSKNMEAKKRNSLTREEINAYNEALEEYNEAIKSFNETNDYLNKTRNQKYNAFNNSVENFYKKFL